MWNLILSICFSVAVGALFKYLRSKSLNVFQMLSSNYFVAVVLSLFVLHPPLHQTSTLLLNSSLAFVVFMGLFLPLVFAAVFYSVQKAGLIRTDIAQRISLIIPVICSSLLFGERISLFKYSAIVVGLIAVILILSKPKKLASSSYSKNSWIYLVIVFLGYGISDLLFKKIALFSALPFSLLQLGMFVFAFIFSLLLNVMLSLMSKTSLKLNYKSFLWGIPLGGFNFFNIYFYLRAHISFAQNPTTVFASMNFGVIILGTLIGYFVFHERLSKKNYLGLVLASVAILGIVISQWNPS